MGYNGVERRPGMAINAEVALRLSGQLNCGVFDASPSKLEFIERPDLDERVWIKLVKLDAIEGIICWVEGHGAGVEFAQPMHPTVLDMLLSAPDLMLRRAVAREKSGQWCRRSHSCFSSVAQLPRARLSPPDPLLGRPSRPHPRQPKSMKTRAGHRIRATS